MTIRRRSSAAVTLSGTIDVDLDHTTDSITIGDETNKLTLIDSGGTKTIPVKIYGAIAGGAAMVDDAAFTIAVDTVNPLGAVYKATPDTIDDGDVGAVHMTSTRAMHVYIKGTDVGAAGGTSATDSAAYTPASTNFTPIGGGYDDVATDSLAEGEMGIVRLTATRKLHVYDSGCEALLTTQAGYLDGIEALLTSANGYQDGIETLITSTNTKLDTIITHVDGLETLIGTTNTNTGNIVTSVQLMDNNMFVDNAAYNDDTDYVAVVGGVYDSAPTALASGDAGYFLLDANHRQDVIIGVALPAGTNNIGDVDVLTLPALPAGTNNIGDVDVLTLPALVAGSAIIGKVSIVDTTGGSCMDDANDSLKVTIVSGAGSGGTAIADEAAFTVATTSFTPIGGVAQTDTGDALLTGKGGAFAMTLTRDLHVNLRNNSGAEITTFPVTGTFWQATQPVSGTFWQATQPVSGTVTVTGVATEATLASLLTSSQLIDDGIATVASAITTKGMAAVGTDGTNARILKTDSSGELQVDVLTMPTVAVTGTFYQATQPVSGTVTVTGVATETTLASALTSLQLLDDVVFTDDAAFTPAASKVLAIGATFDDVATDSVDEGDIGALRMTATRHLMVSVQSAPTTAVTGTFWQATQPVSGTVAVSSIAAGDNNIGNVDVVTLPALAAGTNNIGDVDVLSVVAAASTNKCDIGLINAVTPLMGNGTTGTGSLRVTLASDNTANSNPWLIVGNVAHDTGVSGAPVRIGGRAMLANGTAVAEDDVCDIATDNQGRVIMTQHAPRDLITHTTTTITSSVSETTILAAGAAGVFHDLTQLIITNSSATALIVTIKDDTAGTTRMIVAIAANGGIVMNFGDVPCVQAVAAKPWTATCGTSLASIYFYAQAVKRIA